jgi:hypothetical protein
VERLNLGKLLNTVAGTPVGEAARGIHVGAASVIVADLGCEKFENAFRRFRRCDLGNYFARFLGRYFAQFRLTPLCRSRAKRSEAIADIDSP